MVKQISGMLDHFVARLPRRPAAYLFLFTAWAVTLWVLSANNAGPQHGPDIIHIDKVLHFGYFFGGGALLCAFGGLKWDAVKVQHLFLMVTLICCVIGRLDEYHQGFTPGRSGNDAGDWLADTLGGAAGSWAVIMIMLPRIRSTPAKESKKAA